MLFGTQDKDFFPKDFTGKFQMVKDMGFEAFEVDGKALLEQTDAIRKASERTGLPVISACGGYRGWIGDFIEERRQNGVADLGRMLHALAAVGGKGMVVPAAWGMFTYRLPPMNSPRSVAGDRAALLASLEALEPITAQNNVSIYLEPLNRYQDHMLNTLQDAADLLSCEAFPHVSIVGDFYHMSIEEDDISESLRKHFDRIGHLHIAENHRYQPGTGSIDFSRHFSTLKQLGYDGAIVYEGRVRGENPAAAYATSIVYLKEVYQNAARA